MVGVICVYIFAAKLIRMKKYLFFVVHILLVGIFPTIVQAQKQITHQSQYWLRYSGKYSFSEKWGADLEIENRRYFEKSRQANWVLPRISVSRKLGSGWNIALGFAYYNSANPSDASEPIEITVPELRPHQELNYAQKIKDFGIKHRFRMEERWTRNNDGHVLTDGYSFKGRFRYQLQLQYPLIKKTGSKGTLCIKVADEIMLNIGHAIVQNTFDQNRVYIGLNYGLFKNIQVEFGYLNAFQQQRSGNLYYQRDIARLTVFHSINIF